MDNNTGRQAKLNTGYENTTSALTGIGRSGSVIGTPVAVRDYRVEDLRMQCLRLATDLPSVIATDKDVLATAKQFYEFVTGSEPKPAE